MPQPQKKESFSQRLARIRKARGLSQYDLADMTGISQRMIAHYEKWSKKLDPAVLIKLAKALKVSVDELMGYKALQDKEQLNRRLIKKAKILEGLSPRAQKSVIQMIDTLKAGEKA